MILPMLIFVLLFSGMKDLSSEESDAKAVIRQFTKMKDSLTTLRHDRIYGLLGLCPRSLSIPIRYTDPAEHVYEDAAFRITAWSRSLEILQHAGLTVDTPKHRMPLELVQHVLTIGFGETYSDFRESSAVRSLKLPSWVPRWGWVESAWRSSNSRNLDKFDAALGLPWMAERSDGGALVVSAVLREPVTILFTDERLDMYLSLVYEPQPELAALSTVRKRRSAYSEIGVSKDPREQSLCFWRTLTFDSFDAATLSREVELGTFSTESPIEARWSPEGIQHAVAADA
jgi:hypothetical protein